MSLSIRVVFTKTIAAFGAIALLLSVACGPPPVRDMGMNGSGGGAGSSGGGAGGTGGGGGTSGVQCTVGSDCAYWYCECTGTTTPVNSRTCNNHQCAGASSACNDGCASFGRTWTGRIFSSPGSAGGGGGSSSSSGGPGSSCSTRFDCNPWSCGCTDGAVLTVRDCLNNVCNSKASACGDACYDTGHGDWNGR